MTIPAGAVASAARRAGTAGEVATPVPPWLGIMPRWMWKAPKDYFANTLDFLAIAASGSSTQQVGITADADFMIVFGTRIVTNTANTTFSDNAPFLVTLQDTGAGRSLTSSAIHIDELFGTARQPAYWAFPKIMRASSALSVTIQNLDAANAFNVRIAFHGFKVFAGQGPRE